MIREEKFNLLNELLRYEENNDIGNLTRAERREFQQWISKALEQEPVLDKIRAEIKSLSNANPSYWHSGYMVERDSVFEIIDKYKTESEDKK